jgi:hypothetical protein
LIPVRHGLFELKEFLGAIYSSYNSTLAQQRYRIKYYDEHTGAELVGLSNVKMAIDGCTRRSCGAAAPGGDVQITNFVLSVANFPLSTGRTDHSYLVASVNSGESAIWPKLILFLWAQEIGFVNLKKESNSGSLDRVEEVKGETLCYMEDGAQNPADLVKLPNGSTTRFWVCGDMKELDFIACGGVRDVASHSIGGCCLCL